MRIAESALRRIIRSELKQLHEMMDGPMNPRGLTMTPEEEILSAVMMKPGGKEFLSRVTKAIRAEHGLDKTNPDAVRGFLEAAVDTANGGGIKENDAARGYLKDKLAQARWNQESGWMNTVGMVGASALGALLWSWAAKTGTPIDQFIDAMSHLTFVAGAGAAGAEALDAISAGRGAAELERVLLNKPKPPVKPGPIKPLKIK